MNYRGRANLILGAVFVLFGLTAALRHFHREVLAFKLLFSVLEAALVGGIADWFAVTALFRKPLGISFHTALIPRNRRKLIEAVSHMVEHDLLSMDTIQTKIRNASVIRPLIDWVESHNGVEYFARLAAGLIEEYVLGLDPRETARKLDSIAKRKIGEIDPAAQVKKLGRWALAGEEDDKALNFALERLIALARSPAARKKIYALIREQEKQQTQGSLLKSLLADILEATNSLNLDDAASALHGELVRRLTELKETEHPLRIGIKEILRQSFKQLENNPQWQNSLEVWKQAILRDVPMEEMLVSLVRGVMDKVANGAPLTGWVMEQVHGYWEQFKQDQDLQNWIEGYIKESASRMLLAEHYLIGNVVRDTLGSFSDDELNSFIEARAGDDLQWIRVNGSIIGGIVGLVLFVFLNFFYDPVVAPLVREWLM